MADNIEGRDFNGNSVPIATNEIGGIHYPWVKAGFGAAGTFTAVSAADPLPVTASALPLPAGAASEATAAALSDLLEEVCVRLADIADSVGNLMPDAAGRIRVAAETLGTLATITTVTTVSTVTNMANQTNIGGLAANQQIMALTQMAEQALRQNVVIS
jgi:hypothetical protein